MVRFLLIVIIFYITSFAQVKIGSITIPESTAKEYFLWCYQHPDTVWFSHLVQGQDPRHISSGYTMSEEETTLSNNSIGWIYGNYDTLHTNIDGWTTYRIKVGYLIKRKTSASDFMKWFNNRK